jgi:hypothetical protein
MLWELRGFEERVLQLVLVLQALVSAQAGAHEFAEAHMHKKAKS